MSPIDKLVCVSKQKMHNCKNRTTDLDVNDSDSL